MSIIAWHRPFRLGHKSDQSNPGRNTAVLDANARSEYEDMLREKVIEIAPLRARLSAQAANRPEAEAKSRGLSKISTVLSFNKG